MMDMEIGQIVDYVEEYNRMHDVDEKDKEREEVTKREATQADWNALFG